MHGLAGGRCNPQFVADQKKAAGHRESLDFQSFEQPGFDFRFNGDGREDGQAEAGFDALFNGRGGAEAGRNLKGAATVFTGFT